MASSNAILFVGLGWKIRVVRPNITTHSADMIVNPTDADMSDRWNKVTEQVHRAAGPLLRSRILNKYEEKPLGLPPIHLPDIHAVNSPSGGFFGAVRYTPSFQMSHCDWIVHSRVPLYTDILEASAGNSYAGSILRTLKHEIRLNTIVSSYQR